MNLKEAITKIKFPNLPRLIKTFRNFNSVFIISTMPPGVPF